MALSKTVLKDLMIAKITAEPSYALPPGTDNTWLQEFCDGLADAIVSHITSAAVVNTSDNGSVTTGPGAGGTVVATGVGTVT